MNFTTSNFTLEYSSISPHYVNVSVSFNGNDGTLKTFGDNYLGHSDLLRIIVNTFIVGIISLVGIPSNIINVVVFIRMGIWSDSSNVSLLGLAVADTGSLVAMTWIGILFYLSIQKPVVLNWNPIAVLVTTGSLPSEIFSMSISLITAFVAFERCMSVVYPFKVKFWFSAKKSMIIILCFIVVSVLCNLPHILKLNLTWMNSTSTNTSYLTAVPSKFDNKQLDDISFYMNYLTIQTATVVVVTAMSAVTITHVNSSTRWRHTVGIYAKSKDVRKNIQTLHDSKKESSKPTKQPNINQRERIMVRVITIISILFIISFGPEVIATMTWTIKPDLKDNVQYKKILNYFYFITITIKTINSSIHIVIYYTLSTKYKKVLRAMLRLELPNK